MTTYSTGLDSEDTWVLGLPFILLAIGLLGYALRDMSVRAWPTLVALAKTVPLRRDPLGELTPVQKFAHDDCTTTVCQEWRTVRGEQVVDWVVVTEYADGTESWRRFGSQAPAVAHASDDGLMREW
jgi:hypothetical protein